MSILNFFRKKKTIEPDKTSEDNEYIQERNEWLNKIPECENNENRAMIIFQVDLFNSITGKKLWLEDKYKR